MTLRNLTPAELRSNVQRAERERKIWFKSYNMENRLSALSIENLIGLWNAAYNKGFVAGLEIPRREEPI